MFIVRDKQPIFEEVAGHVVQSVIAIAVGATMDGRPNVVGTGFAVEWAEFYATCWHVAKVHDEVVRLSQEEAWPKGLADTKLRIGVRGKDSKYIWHEVEPKTWLRVALKEDDVCIYRIIGVAVPPLSIQHGDSLSWGSEVGVIGFPLGLSLQGDQIRPFVAKTIIAGGLEMRLPNSNTSGRLALGAGLAGGFSGGPVFSAKTGEVTGMVASKVLEPGEGGQLWPAGISLAVIPGLIRHALTQGLGVTTDTIKKALRSHLP